MCAIPIRFADRIWLWLWNLGASAACTSIFTFNIRHGNHKQMISSAKFDYFLNYLYRNWSLNCLFLLPMAEQISLHSELYRYT